MKNFPKRFERPIQFLHNAFRRKLRGVFVILLSMDGFRVLAVAYKHLQTRATYSKNDESELILKGCIAFLDPPKEAAENTPPG